MPGERSSEVRNSLPGDARWAEAAARLRQQLASGEAPDFETRLKLAELLLASGRRDQARQAYLSLASAAEREGRTARAVAMLQRMDAAWPGRREVERRLADLARGHRAGQGPPSDTALPELPLRRPDPRAPVALGSEPSSALGDSLSEIEVLLGEPALMEAPAPEKVPGSPAPAEEKDEPPGGTAPDDFLDLAAEVFRATPAPGEPSGGVNLLASPLFAALSEGEALAILRRLRVADYEPGDILVTEGEEGQDLFVISGGRANVFVRSPTGRDVLVALLGEGDFFGELSAISGRRRKATVSAATACELLVLSKSDLDRIARAHPRVREALDEAFIQRAGSLAAAVARAIDLTAQGHVREYADVALAARFGRSRWSPRVRLRLSHALIRAGHEEEAVPILAELASALVRAGRPDKARVLLEKIQRVVAREIQEIHLAPLTRAAAPSAGTSPRELPGTAPRLADPEDPGFRRWLDQVLRERSARVQEPARVHRDAEGGQRLLESYGPGFGVCPLFEGLSPGELTDLVGELRVLRADPGDVIVTEGESGQSLFGLLGGSVKVWARDTRGRNHLICRLEEGSFFGEVAALSGRPRCASVTAAEPCVLLELTRDDVASIRAKHPHVGEVLDDYLARRSRTTL